MISAKYKGCLAQQDPRSLRIMISKENKPTITYQAEKLLGTRELRKVINMYVDKYCK